MTDNAAAQPWVLWILGLLLVVGAVIQLLPRAASALVPWVKMWNDWADHRRRTEDMRGEKAQRTADAANQGAFDRQQGQIDELQAQIEAMRQLWVDHATWDRAAYRAILKLGGEIEPPPPLF